MTKLFSMKSLAFAGTAAFAVALAAAPQASAKVTLGEATVDYEKGELTITATKEDAEKDKIVETDDGYCLYVGNGKGSIKKYSLIAGSTDGTDFTFDISGMLGKEVTVGVALDEKGDGAKTATLVAASSVKATLSDDTILIDGTDITKLVDKKYEYKVGTYGNWTSDANSTAGDSTREGESETAKTGIAKAIENAKVLGSTIYVRVADVKDGKQASPWSKEAKVKVPAKAAAPKINVKTAALTKAFSWKMGSKVEFKVATEGKESTEWVPGIDGDWKAILSGAKIDGYNEKLVDGDAIAADVTIQVRTAKTEKKAASNIAVLELAASKNSPTYDQIKVDVVQAKKKTATASAASIAPATLPDGYEAQYSTDGTKWKKLTKGIQIEADKLGSGSTLKIRLVGKDKTKTDLPSAVTTVTIPQNGTKSEDAKSKITAKVNTAASGAWTESTEEDYTITKANADTGATE